jgi:3-deoxy-manno-octulosonate cytidylyltransferase (CMP-KDO synthetase)
MKTIGIIPARYASNRLPGKPLLDLEGKTLIQRVYEQVVSADLDEVVVATDDDRIYRHVEKFGGKSVLTSSNHPSGTDRIAEALEKLEAAGQNFEVVLNVQGDEPFIDPRHLQTLISCFSDQSTVRIATLATPIRQPERLLDPNCVKVVRGKTGKALYFSRQAIPYARDHQPTEWLSTFSYLQHLGVYGFRSETLKQIVQWEPTALERTESLEQLRWLDHGLSIQVELVEESGFGIDTPEDLVRAQQLIKEKKTSR